MLSHVKKIYMLCGLLSIVGFAHADDYRDQVLSKVGFVFYPWNDAYGYESIGNIRKNDELAYNDIMIIVSNTVNAIWWQTFFYTITTNELDRITQDRIITYIEETVRQTVYDKTRDYQLGQRVAKQIIQEVVNIFNRYAELPRGVLKDFIGTALRQKALHYAKLASNNSGYNSSSSSSSSYGQSYSHTTAVSLKPNDSNIASYTPKETCKLYRSGECCVCFEELDENGRVFVPLFGDISYTQVDNIFLAYYLTCGHDICKTCAKSLIKHNNNTCPQCRASLNMTLLSRILSKMNG